MLNCHLAARSFSKSILAYSIVKPDIHVDNDAQITLELGI